MGSGGPQVGDEGTFITFDGPPYTHVVVSFPQLTFVASQDHVELVSPAT